MGKKRWKDRKDGRYLYDADPMHKFMPYLMPKRTECEVFLREGMDATKILEYLEDKKRMDGNKITLFSLLMSTLVRTFAIRPDLNNFIAGHRLYRRNKIDIGFIVKREFTDAGSETMVRMTFDPSMTINEVSEKLYAHIDEFRSLESAGADNIVRKFSKLPRFMTKSAIAFLRFLNYFGWVPKGLIESDPNFASAFVTNMGSLKANAPFHHLNNWGTGSVFISIGAIEDRVCVINGEMEIRKCFDLAFTVDERIADGYYFIRSIQVMKEILSDPVCLERPFAPEVGKR
jgi:hypothetical protein